MREAKVILAAALLAVCVAGCGEAVGGDSAVAASYTLLEKEMYLEVNNDVYGYTKNNLLSEGYYTSYTNDGGYIYYSKGNYFFVKVEDKDKNVVFEIEYHCEYTVSFYKNSRW